jgi:hypothetical protein
MLHRRPFGVISFETAISSILATLRQLMMNKPKASPAEGKAAIETKTTVNSLFSQIDSLFLEVFSLLTCVGNCSRSACSIETHYAETGSRSPKIAKFPVKFPVSREFAWRPVRSALRRQPGSVAIPTWASTDPRKAR